MRITFILPTAGMGGGTKVVAIYAKELKGLGHAVRVISLPAHAVSITRKMKDFVKGDGWPHGRVRRQSHLDGTGVEHHILERWRPVTNEDVSDGDIVIATWWETAEWVYALSPSKGARVYFIQGHEIFPHLPVVRCHATYRMPLHKIVISRWLREIMSAEYDDNVVDVVPNSVDRAQFWAPVRGKHAIPTVGFLYSTVAFKGLDVVLGALQTLREQMPNLRAIAFGSSRVIRAVPILEGTEYFHAPPQGEIRNLYARCDVWVSASRSEGFNLPAMEAMACRTPVVSTRTGWPEEALTTGQNGVLVDIDDVEGLVRGVEWVLSRDDAKWKQLSSNAYTTAVTGSWEQSARLFEAALEHARKRFASGELQPRIN